MTGDFKRKYIILKLYIVGSYIYIYIYIYIFFLTVKGDGWFNYELLASEIFQVV